MSLIKQNEAIQTWQNTKVLLGGESGVGKTTFAAQDEAPLFLCFENGLADLKVKCAEITNYSLMEKVLEELNGLRKDFPFTSIVFDGLDDYLIVIDEMVMTWARSKYKKEVMDNVQSIGDLPNGTGWARQRMYALHFIKQFASLPCALIILSHTKNKTIGNGANAYQKVVLNSPTERLSNAIKGFCDHVVIARTTVRGNQKTVYLNASDRMDCIGKSRGTDGKNPKPLIKDGLIWDQAKENGDDAPARNFKKFRELFQ